MKNTILYLVLISPIYCFGTNYYFETSGDYSLTSNWQGGIAPPSSITNSDSVFISNSSTCTLDIAISNNGYFEIENNATFTINSAFTSTSNWVNNGNTEISSGNTFFTAGIMTNNSSMTITGTLEQYAEFYNNGSVIYSGSHKKPGFAFYNYGTYEQEASGILEMLAVGGIDQEFINFSGSVSIFNGTTDQLGWHRFLNYVGSAMTITTTASFIQGIFIVNSGTLLNEGLVKNLGGTPNGFINIDSIGSFTNDGFFEVQQIGLNNGDFINNDTCMITGVFGIQSDGNLINNNYFFGDFSTGGFFLNNGSVSNNAQISIVGQLMNGGNVFGNGVFTGSITGGNYSPGNPIGQDSILNNLTTNTNSTISIDIGGLLQNVEYDNFVVVDTFDCQGTLNVNLEGGFVPSLNDEFEIINYGTRINFFTQTSLPSLPSNLEWDIIYSNSNVKLKIIQDGGGSNGGSSNVGINTESPLESLEVKDGKVYINSIGEGLIMRSPSGQCFEIKVDNNGVVSTIQIPCPQN